MADNMNNEKTIKEAVSESVERKLAKEPQPDNVIYGVDIRDKNIKKIEDLVPSEDRICIEGEIFKGLYLVHNWDELVSTLELLRKGEDSLKAKREEITKNHFNISAEGAGFKIKEIIKEDFLNA